MTSSIRQHLKHFLLSFENQDIHSTNAKGKFYEPFTQFPDTTDDAAHQGTCGRTRHTFLSLPNTTTATITLRFSCKKQRPESDVLHPAIGAAGRAGAAALGARSRTRLAGTCYCTGESLPTLLFTWTPDWQALCAFNINRYKKKHDILDLQSLPSHRFVEICTWSEATFKKGESCQIC